MVQPNWVRFRACRETVALAALVLLMSAGAHAQDSATKSAADFGKLSAVEPGRIEFDYADGPQAAVEFDLGPGMAGDLFGIGDAAVAGVADALAKAAGAKQGAEGTRFAADQVKAAEQIVATLKEVVRGVRVRVYNGQGDQTAEMEKLIGHYNDKLKAENWETILKAHERNQTVTVSAIRGAGGIKGVFVAATDGHGTALVNVVCDISPENVKKLSTVAMNSGLQAGLGQVLEAKFSKMHPPAQQGPVAKPADGQ
jgi:hypothetical protein